MIRFDAVKKSFGTREVLHHVTFSVEPGETICLFGPSGWGKSTILNLASGIIHPDKGKVIRDCDHIGYAFQKDLLLPWKSAIDNITYVLENRYTKDCAREKARLWLEKVNLAEDADKRPSEMSGGMRKRLSIARALSVDPQILLLDEPFAFLDDKNINLVQRLLLDDELLRSRATILVTHIREHAHDLGCRVINITERPITIP